MVLHTGSHYPERASVLHFKDAAALRFDHSDVVFDLFIETFFCIELLSYAIFRKFSCFLGITEPKQFDFMSKIPQIPFI